MKRLFWIGGAMALAMALGIGGELAFFALAARSLPRAAATPSRPVQLRGAYHVHSKLSDGRGTPEEIAAAAARAGLHFVVLTDHNLETIPPPRVVEGVLLIFATELSTDSGHVVAVDLARGLTGEERAQGGEALARVHAQGGAAFLAHPVQRKAPWRDWEAARAADGMELYSGDSFFREALERPFDVFFPAAGAFLTRPAWGLWALARESPRTRERFLELAKERRPSALCALDAHGWPGGYEPAFRAMSLYVSLPDGSLDADPIVAARQVTAGLRRGAFHCGFGDWASADGFSLRGEVDAERRVPVGAVLEVVLPPSPPGRVRVDVYGGGKRVEGDRIRVERPGAVWVEVWVRPEGGLPAEGWRPWIVASPLWGVSR